MPTRIVLVRHARSVLPEFGVPDSDERPLTPEGMASAQDLVPRLVSCRPVAVLSSPLLRAVQTVAPTAQALGLEVITWPELREWRSGVVPSTDYVAQYEHSWAHPGSAHGDGESLDELTTRASRALARIADEYPDATVLVGSHGMFVSRALMATGHHADMDLLRVMPMPAIYEIVR